MFATEGVLEKMTQLMQKEGGGGEGKPSLYSKVVFLSLFNSLMSVLVIRRELIVLFGLRQIKKKKKVTPQANYNPELNIFCFKVCTGSGLVF